jgi:hypothetical protein
MPASSGLLLEERRERKKTTIAINAKIHNTPPTTISINAHKGNPMSEEF